MSLTIEELTVIRDRDLESLLDRTKLNLILDLDHTLVHVVKRSTLLTSSDKLLINPKSVICIGDFAIRLRPGVVSFLKEASTMFDLSIFTLGNRNYAKMMVEVLEKRSGVKFKQVLSKEDCLVAKEKTVEVVLSHEQVVLIVDNSENAWKKPYDENNLVKIAPYNFFGTTELCDICGDEETMDAELSRVFDSLTSVHSVFYEYDAVFGEVDYSTQDVREILGLVRFCEGEHENDVAAKNRKRPLEVVFDQKFESCHEAKRYKTFCSLDFEYVSLF